MSDIKCFMLGCDKKALWITKRPIYLTDSIGYHCNLHKKYLENKKNNDFYFEQFKVE